MTDNIVKIGDFNLLAPADHKLPVYLAQFPEYDFRYWSIIEKIAKSLSSEDYAMIDIGANIGDTIAHFRSFSAGDVLAVEAHAGYFPYLLKNTDQFESVKTIYAAMSTPAIKDNIALFCEHGTGRTEVDEDSHFEGKIVYAGGLISQIAGDFILKSDTDGFDGTIISSFIEAMSNQDKFAKIVTFEGPSRQQGLEGEIEAHLEAIKGLQELDYEILLLSNLGQPLSYCGCNFKAVEFIFSSWLHRLKNKDFRCPYFDIIAVKDKAFPKIIKTIFKS